MKIKLILITFFAIVLIKNIFGQIAYVKVNDSNFELNGNKYYPLVLNYLISFTKDYNTNTYYLSPNWNYSDYWDYPYPGYPVDPGRYCYSKDNDKEVSLIKLGKDLTRIKNMGFNTIRVGIAPYNNNGMFEIPTGSYLSYFSIVDQLLNSVASHNLKAILIIGPPKAWEIHESYKTYLENIAGHLKNNQAVMAYDLYNEPSLNYSLENRNDKYKISNWVSEWCYTIKKFDSNHLITIGIGLENTLSWDPLVMPIDFISYHLYSGIKDLQASKDIISAYLYWIAKAIKMPWIIGETGYTGTNDLSINDPSVGTEQNQADYALFTMQKSLNCGCQGYSWWQYQDINWYDPTNDSYYQVYFGLINRYGKTNGFLNETDKKAANVFSSFWSMIPNPTNCSKPDSYYNIHNYDTIDLTGWVVDDKGLPIENAFIMGWKQIEASYPSYITFSDANGYFVLHSNTPNNNINTLWISFPGYSVVTITNPTSDHYYMIKPINYNQWTKKWTNDGNNTIDGWTVRNFDKFYKGDFDGNGKDELLCVQYTGGAKDWMTMLYYNNSTGDWDWGWSNYGNSSVGDGIYPYRHNLIVGDFDGDGRDDILGNRYPFNGWLTTFKFGIDGQFHWWQSSYGYINDNSYPLSYIQPYNNYIIAGDFDGDGRDDLLGSDLPNGWTTWFKFGLNNQWQWVQTDNGYTNNPSYSMSYMRPYRDQYIVGDFDGDGRDEVLGNDLPNGWMTLFGFENDNWQWVWSDAGNDVIGIRPYRNNLIVGNFDDDSKDELLGFKTWATKFDFESGSFIWGWSTYDSGILSDWTIQPAALKYLSIKTYKYSPDQLIAFRKIGTIFSKKFLVNMYSFNR